MKYIIRPIKTTDEAFLWEILYQALYIPPGKSPLPKDIVFQPQLAKYVANWKPNQDTGFIAATKDKTSVGATWLRVFTSNDPGYGYIDDYTPELTIAVLPKYRAQGVGTKLLTKLFSQAKSYYSSVSLSISSDNPAFKLYRRFGFEIISQHNNSLIMKKDF